MAYASRLCLHPHVDTWKYSLKFSFGNRRNSVFFMSEGFLGLREYPRGKADFRTEKMEKGLSEFTKSNLHKILAKHPRMATWHMFPMVDAFTGIFHNVVKDTKMSWETSRTQGYQIKARTAPPPTPDLFRPEYTLLHCLGAKILPRIESTFQKQENLSQ